MPKYTGINHLAMVTGDMDATVRFWRDLLGMRLIIGLGHPGYRHYFFEIAENDMIAFFEWPGVKPLEERDHGFPVKGRVGFDHISFGVDSEADLWGIKDKLEAAGMWCSEVVDHGFIHSIYAFDPNNIPIEFSSTVAGVDLRKTPVMTDTEPSREARKGAEPQAGVWPEVSHPTPESDWVAYEGEGQKVLEVLRKRETGE